jgi:hypothetical protein
VTTENDESGGMQKETLEIPPLSPGSFYAKYFVKNYILFKHSHENLKLMFYETANERLYHEKVDRIILLTDFAYQS